MTLSTIRKGFRSATANARSYTKHAHFHEGHSLSSGRAEFSRPANEHIHDFLAGSALRKSVDKEIQSMKSQVVEIPLIIGGREIFTNNVQEVVIPHDHKHVIARYHKAGPEQTQQAIDAALKAKKEWASLDFEMRALFFSKVAELVAGPWRSKILAATILNQSKNYFQAEIDATVEFIDFLRFNNHFAQKIYSEQPLSVPSAFNRSVYRPLEGFVYAVSPFNFTSIAGNLNCAPALMGNTTLWKPSDSCVFSNYTLMRLFMEAGLPPGVINFIPGDAEAISNVALSHRELAGVHFTGSTEVFKGIFQKVAANMNNYRGFPRLVGETGGKNFVLAHSSADVAAVATALIRGSFEFAGQKCSASSRAFIPVSLWSKIKGEILSQMESVKMGNPEHSSTLVNAVIHKGSYNRCVEAIEAAKKDPTCEIVYGGESSDKVGYFVHPTIVRVHSPEHFIMQKEFFGPILGIYLYEDNAFESICHTIDQTSSYALTGSIFAQDRHAISKATHLLEHAAGNFYINDKPTGAVVGQQPFGGARASGTNDKAGSPLNLLRWTSPRTIKETFVPPTHFKYPYMDS